MLVYWGNQINPMNYIKKLENENIALKKQLSDLNNDLTNFMSYLNSPKFQGDGKNYIEVGEVFIRMRELRIETLTN